jgi:hypothetical protein
MTKPLTALEVLADRSLVANRSMYKHQDEAKTWKEANHVDMKSYRNGEAIAYNDAHHIMQRELERLRNLWQNGALTYADFGLPY